MSSTSCRRLQMFATSFAFQVRRQIWMPCASQAWCGCRRNGSARRPGSKVRPSPLVVPELAGLLVVREAVRGRDREIAAHREVGAEPRDHAGTLHEQRFAGAVGEELERHRRDVRRRLRRAGAGVGDVVEAEALLQLELHLGAGGWIQEVERARAAPGACGTRTTPSSATAAAAEQRTDCNARADVQGDRPGKLIDSRARRNGRRAIPKPYTRSARRMRIRTAPCSASASCPGRAVVGSASAARRRPNRSTHDDEPLLDDTRAAADPRRRSRARGAEPSLRLAPATYAAGSIKAG